MRTIPAIGFILAFGCGCAAAFSQNAFAWVLAAVAVAASGVAIQRLLDTMRQNPDYLGHLYADIQHRIDAGEAPRMDPGSHREMLLRSEDIAAFEADQATRRRRRSNTNERR